MFEYYGGRGITICDKWLKFEGFYEDMHEGYADKLTIDRIDNDKGYFKENCRWATRKQQNRNTIRTVYIKHKGKKRLLIELAEENGIEYRTLYYRIFRYKMSVEKALINKNHAGVKKGDKRGKYKKKT